MSSVGSSAGISRPEVVARVAAKSLPAAKLVMLGTSATRAEIGGDKFALRPVPWQSGCGDEAVCVANVPLEID